MPLDEATRRFAFLLQRDLRRMAERRAEYDARGDELQFDSVSRIATVQTGRGDAVLRLYGEVLATYSPYDRILRWAWAGRAPSARPTHGDVVFGEGQARCVPQLAMSVVGELDAADAASLVMLGALLARAEAVHERTVDSDVEFVGLFERPGPAERTELRPDNRYSVPPPPMIEKSPSSGPPPRAYRSLPPIREVFEPRSGGARPPGATGVAAGAGSGAPWSNLGAAGVANATASSIPPAVRKLREPSRELFLPVASAALEALTRGSDGYLQGLFVLTLDAEPKTAEPRRLTVQLVVIDLAGILRALDPPRDVLDAAAAMVEADRRDGNGSWRKVSARITPKPDGGATLHVDVL